ncbi:biliverdin-producing heme oxygenase [Actinocorallia sp. API 0066]|uniref:biliverdin-producing heme oxygenase n=1 Tax=Actinocorallia sp. API 0066 TaxID=2896846 RepID=UPI001E44594F|nr:biliverdin-producing heme oxygenase [Actinocorallia sp. API 0066]MCD0449016.1 biliverdin-producing heme oxygenase [Actinocorallia sp. API 0066]
MTEAPEAAFSAVLRQASATDHAEAESAGYMSDLMSGKLPLAAFAALTARLHPVYAALEEAAEAMREHPVAGRFVHDELTRTPSLEADLAFLRGADWAEQAENSPAADAYAARIREVAFTSPEGFVAHHYTRYLGDLSGGLIIGRTIERLYDLSDGRGVSFYRFGEIPKPKNFKDAYRTLIDEAPFDPDGRALVVAEVREAYRLNSALFAELGAIRWNEAA